MQRPFFSSCEALSQNESLSLRLFIDQLAFNDQGLLPVITQEVKTGQVLMLAWMNKLAIYKTLETEQMTYWSRSRQSLWTKGATSGHYQYLESMQFDCDGDSILCKVSQKGAACHTGRKDCFYFKVKIDQRLINITSNIP